MNFFNPDISSMEVLLCRTVLYALVLYWQFCEQAHKHNVLIITTRSHQISQWHVVSRAKDFDHGQDIAHAM